MSLLGLGAAHAGAQASEDTHQGGLTGGVPDAKKAQHKKLAYISIAVGVVGALIAWLAYRNQQSSAATATTATPTTSATGTTGTGTVAGYSTDGSQSSYDQAIINALSGLQSSINNLPVSSSPAPVPTPSPSPVPSTPPSGLGAESLQGSGYWWGANNPSPVGTAQGLFSWLSPAEAKTLAPGTMTYYQPQPGVFAPNQAGLLPGTPAFVKVPPISGATHSGA